MERLITRSALSCASCAAAHARLVLLLLLLLFLPSPHTQECLPAEPEQAARDCCVCFKAIEDVAVLAAGKSYHSACFACATCRAPIGEDGAFDMYQDRVYHPKCVPAGALPACRSCGKLCMDTSTVFEGQFYHKYALDVVFLFCFSRNPTFVAIVFRRAPSVTRACRRRANTSRSETSFITTQNVHRPKKSVLAVMYVVPSKKETMSSQNSSLQKTLTNPAVNVEGESWHRDCFKCAKCHGLFDREYVKVDGKHLHVDCAK